MVGFYCVVGETQPDTRETTPLRWEGSEPTERTESDRLSVTVSGHRSGEQRPVLTDDGDALWLVGDLHGHQSESYRSRFDEEPVPTARVFAGALYEEYGTEFVAGANGTFAALVHQRDRNQVRVLTDRLGTRPVYVASLEGGVVLSTQIQAVAAHPDVEVRFDEDALREYLATNRVLGLDTPIEGIRELPPGSVTTVDLTTGALESESYWRLSYEPSERPYGAVVEEFTEVVAQVLDERRRDPRRYGLLLSGGSDSRLILAGLRPDTKTYHIAEWMSREARTAEWVALSTDREFRLLQQPVDHHDRMLAHVPRKMNVGGRFDQAHLHGFHTGVAAEVDVLASGLYGDTFYKGGIVPKRTLSVGRLGQVRLPVEREYSTLSALLDAMVDEYPPFVEREEPLVSLLGRKVTRRGEGVVAGGVEYGSLREFALFGGFYPLSNDRDYHYFGLSEMLPHWTPFLDNRLLDIALTTPQRHLVRGELIDAALRSLSPDLASIPHSETGVPPTSRFPRSFLRKYATLAYRRHVNGDGTPNGRLSHRPWRHRGDILRERRFPEQVFEAKQGLLAALSVVDADAAVECYCDHLDGDDHTAALCALLTLLEMPLTERALGTERVPDPDAVEV
jgi:asparagine synthase (glutamine-hydrolysing)